MFSLTFRPSVANIYGPKLAFELTSNVLFENSPNIEVHCYSAVCAVETIDHEAAVPCLTNKRLVHINCMGCKLRDADSVEPLEFDAYSALADIDCEVPRLPP